MSDQSAVCQICGLPMPPGEEMFNYHGYSGPCPVTPTAHQPRTKRKLSDVFDGTCRNCGAATKIDTGTHCPACACVPTSLEGEG